MISDVLCEAVEAIKGYQERFPETYTNLAEEIEIVKNVMWGLRIMLDIPEGGNWAEIAKTLSNEERKIWRLTCEANIARWVECLKLLGPISAEDLVPRLKDAIARNSP